EVVEQRYNGFGDVSQTIAYALRLTSLSLGQMRGGQLTQSVSDAFALLDNDQATRVSLRYYQNGALGERGDAMGGIVQYLVNSFGETKWKSEWSKPGMAYQDLSITLYAINQMGQVDLTSVDNGGLGLTQQVAYDLFGRSVQVSRSGRGV